MNYIVLNGVNSNTIQGLLIQSLPPITKPQIRTQVEEIDGRDGDIITKLGYAAYDKEMSIGLYGDYDVDDVIQYFDSEGVVTFSNEPDKYYNYQIVEQIDFERLIRFKTATVTFHVQPFKYSTIQPIMDFNVSESIEFEDSTIEKNGITMELLNGIISVSGTASTATEIYMPIKTMSIDAGSYTLNAYVGGMNSQLCSIRLINDSPSAANSFGGTYVTLNDAQTVSINATLTTTKTYNYLYFYITAGTAMDFSMSVSIINNAITSETVTNTGNTQAKPKITIYGSGTINLSLNGTQVFTINLDEYGDYLTIDVAEMQAYQNGILRNRSVIGDYDNFILNIGKNIISWTGDVTEIEIDNYSRWI